MRISSGFVQTSTGRIGIFRYGRTLGGGSYPGSAGICWNLASSSDAEGRGNLSSESVGGAAEYSGVSLVAHHSEEPSPCI